MPKRHTSKTRRRQRASVLEVRVLSPRIAWFGFLKVLGGAAKIACILAAAGGTGWGIWQGVRHSFYQNPDFRLQAIDLNANPALDEAGVAKAAGIDLTASLFKLDVEAITAKLEALPQIADARVERHLPGTLMVRVTAREPRAWIASPAAGLPSVRAVDGLLVDGSGIAYPCPLLQFKTAAALPIIELPAAVAAGEKILQPQLERCLRLLDAAAMEDPDALQRIESVRQVNDWSLLLVTREGTAATFGLGDHERQISHLRAALDHANRKGRSIGSINLIPRHNVPVILREEDAEPAPPPRAVPVAEPGPVEIRQDRKARDLDKLLNRG